MPLKTGGLRSVPLFHIDLTAKPSVIVAIFHDYTSPKVARVYSKYHNLLIINYGSRRYISALIIVI